MSKVLFQIDSCLGIGSTGRISESIGTLARANGWETYIAHGARYVGKSQMHAIQIGSKWSEYFHYAQGLLLDNHGLASVDATKYLIKEIEKIRPDVIQLHCIHGYYLNYKLLFEYLNQVKIPVVWTFHDCWAFTGHCAHFVTVGCEKWKMEGCHDCALKSNYPKSFFDFSRRNYKLKKNLFGTCENIHIVAVSDWLASLAKESFFAAKDIRVIHNGIDIDLFKGGSVKKESIILGVATSWGANKGLYDFYKLRKLLPFDKFKIVLVGLTKKQIADLPNGIKGVERTNSIQELAVLYAKALALVNPTYADSFPTVNMEALACGTPVITYRTGGSPEIIDDKTGFVVEQGDINGLLEAIYRLDVSIDISKACRKRAEQLYDKNQRFMDYINLYEELINK